jgi:hypothetical protein
MGGQTQSKNTTSFQNQATNQTGSSQLATAPWAGNDALLRSLYAQLGGVASDVTPPENAALDRLGAIGAAGSPFAPAIGSVANTLLSGGGPDRSGLASDAYDRAVAQLNPTARGDYLDPNKNPFFNQTTQTIGNDVENRLKALYAGSGRDPSGAGGYAYQLARGISEGTAPTFANVYQGERTNQLGAAKNLYDAGTGTAGLLSSLDQARLANMQAGIGAADAANAAQLWGPQLMLQAEAARRGIPLQTLAQELGLVIPGAQAFGTRSGTTAQTGTQFGTGNEQSTTSTPFNPWSLAPLAFLPMSGGASLGGSLLGDLGGGLFSSLSRGFMRPGSFNRS